MEGERKSETESQLYEDRRANLDVIDGYIECLEIIEKPTYSALSRRKKIVNYIKVFIKNNYPIEFQKYGYTLIDINLFGSSATKLATDKSDIDLCITLKNEDEVEAAHETRKNLLKRICQIFETRPDIFTDIQFIGTAMVPIIKCVAFGTKADISLNISKNPPPTCLSARLLNAYMQIDDRLLPLIRMIRTYMFRKHKYDKIQQYPNSYSCGLLAVFVMQKHEMLPNLYTEKLLDVFTSDFNDIEGSRYLYPISDDDITLWNGRVDSTADKLSVADLFLLFLKYFSQYKPMHSYTYDVRSLVVNKKNSSHPGLLIVDPLDKNNPGRVVRDSRQICRAMKADAALILWLASPDLVLPAILNIRFPYHDNQNSEKDSQLERRNSESVDDPNMISIENMGLDEHFKKFLNIA